MRQISYEDEIDRIPLDRNHLLALALSIVVCLFGGELLYLVLSSIKIPVSFWQAFTLVAFLLLSMVYLYRSCLHLATALQGKLSWHREGDMDIVAAILWMSVTGALLFAWILSIVVPSSLCSLFLAAFCLVAMGALGRFILLLAPPLSLDL